MAQLVKNPPANAGYARDVVSVPGLGRSPGEGNGDTVPCSPMQSHEQRSLASYGSQRVGPNWMTNVVEATCGRAVWRVKKPPSEGVDKRLTWPESPSSSERQRWLVDCSGHSKDGRMTSSQIESLCTLVICLFSWKGIGSELGACRRDFRELSWARGPAVLKEAQLQVWRPADRPGRTSQAGWAVERGQMTQPQYCSGQPFPSPGDLSNPGLPHCRWILYQLSHKGSPRILEWAAFPLPRGSSQPRSWTRVSCTADGFFTNWAIREASPLTGDGFVSLWTRVQF